MADTITPQPEHAEFLFYRAKADKSEPEIVHYCDTVVRDWFAKETAVDSADYWLLKHDGLLVLAVAVDDESGTDWSFIKNISDFFEVVDDVNQLVIEPREDLAFRRA